MVTTATQDLARLERKARRDERRERQRQNNITRAEKMHAARLQAVGRPGATERAPVSASARQFNVGCSGWFYWHWRGLFYPPGSSTNTWFDHYAARFRTVELNAPFYSW